MCIVHECTTTPEIATKMEGGLISAVIEKIETIVSTAHALSINPLKLFFMQVVKCRVPTYKKDFVYLLFRNISKQT